MKVYLDIESRKVGDGDEQVARDLQQLKQRLEAAGVSADDLVVRVKKIREASAAIDQVKKGCHAVADAMKLPAAEAQRMERTIHASFTNIYQSSGKSARDSARAFVDAFRSQETAAKRAADAVIREQQRAAREVQRLQERERRRQERESQPPAPLAGIGALNLMSKLPGGQIAGVIGGATGLIPGIGQMAVAFGAVLTVSRLIGAAWDGLVSIGKNLISTILGLVKEGFEYNAMIQQSRLGVAAMITTFTDIKDIQGNLVKGEAAWAAAMQISTRIQGELRAAALKTGATYEQLVRALQEGAGPALSKGFSARELTQFTVQISQVAQAIGLPFEQLNQEIRGVLEGDMSRHSRIARLLLADLATDAKKHGKTVKDALMDMAKGGTLFDFLSERMKAFQKAAEDGAHTFTVAMSNLKDAWQSALGQATLNGTNAVTSAIEKLTAAIVTFDQYGNAHFNEGLLRGMTAIADVTSLLISKIINLVSHFDTLYLKIKAFMNLSWGEKLQTLGDQFLNSKLGRIASILNPALGIPLQAANLVNGGSKAFEDEQNRILADQNRVKIANDQGNRAMGQLLLRNGASFQYGDQTISEKLNPFTFGKDVNQREVEATMGKFKAVYGDAATVQLMRNLNAATKDGSLTMAEFTKAVNDASYGGFQLEKTLDDGGKKAKDYTAAINGLINSAEALADKGRSAVGSGSDLIAKTDEMIRRGEMERRTNQLNSEMSAMQAQIQDLKGAGGEKNVGGIEAIRVLEAQVALRKEILAVEKAQADQQAREAAIDELERRRNDILNKRAVLLREIEELQKKLGGDAGKHMTPGQREQFMAQIGNASASADQLAAQARTLLDQISTLQKENATTTEAAITAAHEAGAADRAKVDADAANKTTAVNAAAAKKALRDWKDTIREIKKVWDDFANSIGKAVESALFSLMQGGGLKDAIKGFAEDMQRSIAGTLGNMTAEYFKNLTAVAKTGKNEDGSDATMSQGKARGILGVTMAAGAAYGIWNQGGTRSQNAMGGAMSGMATGASIGSLFPGWGTVIGAVVGLVAGAILGAFAPTGTRMGMKFTIGANGQISVTGTGDTHQWQAAKALRDINHGIAEARSSMFDIFMGLPTSVLEAMSKNFVNPTMKPGTTEIKPVRDAAEAVTNFITADIPRMVLESYLPALAEAAQVMGVSADKTYQLTEYLKGLDFKDAQKAVADFFSGLYTLAEIASFEKMSTTEKLGYASKKANMTVPEQLGEMDKRLGLLVPKDFASLPMEQQISLTQKLLPLIQQRYDLEMQYLAKIADYIKSSKAAIDDQIFGYTVAGLTKENTPQEQMDLLLARGRSLKDQIKTAATPEEVSRLQAEYQKLVDQMVQLAGNRPEDRAHAVAMLNDLQDIVDKRYKELAEAVSKMAQPYLDQVGKILDALQNGLDALLPKPVVPTPGTEEPAPDPNGPPQPDDPYADITAASNAAAGDITALGAAAAAAANAWQGQFGSPSEGDGRLTASSQSAGGDMVITAPQPVVNITLTGDFERFMNNVRAQIVNESVERTITVMSNSRRRATRR